MEFGSGGSDAVNRRRKCYLTLDKYLDFMDCDRQSNLSIVSLNQIVSMHGFKKLKTDKEILIDAVKTIELMDLTRSTIKHNHVSSNAFINTKDAIKDLNSLGWIECSVTSFKSLCSLYCDRANFLVSSNIASHCQKRQPKVKKKALNDPTDLEGKQTALTLFEPPCFDSPKRKRSKLVPVVNKGVDSACSLAVSDHCAAKGKRDDCATAGLFSPSSSMVSAGVTG